MMLVDTEFYLPMAEAGRIVREFMNVTVKEFKAVECDKFINCIINDIISKEHLSAEKVQDMTYIELICLIDHAGGNSKYDRDGCDSVTRQMFYCLNLARALIEAGAMFHGRGTEAVDKFQKLPIEQFYAYMDSIAAWKDMSAEFAYIRDCCEYRDYYSILDFILEKSWQSDRPWRMAEPLEKFGERIRTISKDIERILIDSFHMVFPDRFHVTDICNKYYDVDGENRKDSSLDDTEPGDESAHSFHEVFSESTNIPGTNIPKGCYRSLHIADSTIEGDRFTYLRLLAPLSFTSEEFKSEPDEK